MCHDLVSQYEEEVGKLKMHIEMFGFTYPSVKLEKFNQKLKILAKSSLQFVCSFAQATWLRHATFKVLVHYGNPSKQFKAPVPTISSITIFFFTQIKTILHCPHNAVLCNSQKTQSRKCELSGAIESMATFLLPEYGFGKHQGLHLPQNG